MSFEDRSVMPVGDMSLRDLVRELPDTIMQTGFRSSRLESVVKDIEARVDFDPTNPEYPSEAFSSLFALTDDIQAEIDSNVDHEHLSVRQLKILEEMKERVQSEIAKLNESVRDISEAPFRVEYKDFNKEEIQNALSLLQKSREDSHKQLLDDSLQLSKEEKTQLHASLIENHHRTNVLLDLLREQTS